MVSQTAGAFDSKISTVCTPEYSSRSFLCSFKEEDEERKNQAAARATPIDLAVALESACWDLDFLVRFNFCEHSSYSC
jgi:hypothetical protein